ncbi:MAG: hypothetical protein IKY91_09730 [Akkermansia sp.]|nr:hypothetical protein [Akkermansia sp.]
MNTGTDYIGQNYLLAAVGILLTLLGLILVFGNWYSIIEWVLTIRRNPRYNRGEASVPLLGGDSGRGCVSEGIRIPELYDFPQAKKKAPVSGAATPGGLIYNMS